MSTKKNPRMQLAAYKRWCADKLDDLKDFGEKYKDGIPPEMRGQFERLVNDLRDQFTRSQTKWDQINDNVAEDTDLFEELEKLVSDVGKTMDGALFTEKRYPPGSWMLPKILRLHQQAMPTPRRG